MKDLAWVVAAALALALGGCSGCSDDGGAPPIDAGPESGGSGGSGQGGGGGGGVGGESPLDGSMLPADSGSDADADAGFPDDDDGGVDGPTYYGVCGQRRVTGYDRQCDGVLDRGCGITIESDDPMGEVLTGIDDRCDGVLDNNCHVYGWDDEQRARTELYYGACQEAPETCQTQYFAEDGNLLGYVWDNACDGPTLGDECRVGTYDAETRTVTTTNDPACNPLPGLCEITIYDEAGRVIRQQQGPACDQLESCNLYEYDAQGRLTAYKAGTSCEGMMAVCETYAYADTDAEQQERLDSDVGCDGPSAEDSCIEVTATSPDTSRSRTDHGCNGSFEECSETEATYDGSERLVRLEYFGGPACDQLIGCKDFEHDAAGRLIGDVDDVGCDGVFDLDVEACRTFEHDSEGTVIKTTVDERCDRSNCGITAVEPDGCL